MTAKVETKQPAGPLTGLRIVDLSTVVAGPFASALLGDLGAQVTKVEVPGRGDALRALAPYKDGVGLWSKVTNRNKQGVTLDLHSPLAREPLARLLRDADVVVENFRPGTLDRWGLTREWLHGVNPRLTILRVTGFGQTGPYRNRPGFARVFEAMSGFTHICGDAHGTPLHLGYPISDAIGGLFGALGVLAALYRLKADPTSAGQEIDCSVTEAMLRVLEFMPIEYDQLGSVRARSGNTSQYAAPGNVYRTRDGHWASIAGSTQSIFERLGIALGREAWLVDPRFATNADRVAHREVLDAEVADAVGEWDMAALRDRLDSHEVGFSPINDIADVFADPQFIAREALVTVHDSELGDVRMQGVVPRFSLTPGAVQRAGPALGEHNDAVWSALGFDAQEVAALRAANVI